MNARRAVVAVLFALLGVAAVIGVVKLLDAVGDPDPGAGGLTLGSILPTAKPAAAPFAGLTQLMVGVGGKCTKVAVADSEPERVEGLRGRRDLGGYGGMLFVFQGPSTAAFTMSTVPVALDIGFYGSNGDPVSRRHMLPCPHAEAQCPVYRAAGPFTYALETLGGRLPRGGLAACSPS